MLHTTFEVRYYAQPVVIVFLGVAIIVFGILLLIFRVRVKALFNAGQRMMFGDRVGDLMQAVSIRWLVIPFCVQIAFGILFVVFGIVGIITDAHVYPQPQ